MNIKMKGGSHLFRDNQSSRDGLKNTKAAAHYGQFRKGFLKVSTKIFSPFFTNDNSVFLDNVQTELSKAEMGESSRTYISGILFVALIFGLMFSASAIVTYLAKGPYILFTISVPISIVVVIGIGTFFPSFKSSQRGKKIDENLGSAFAFISAMSSADVPINSIILKLSKKREYGEVSREAMKIATRTELLGLDIFTAMQQVARMSPSVEWQKFLQGAVATSSAGSRLKPYFVTKATEYQNKLRVSLKKNAESVLIFAETYITIGVAFPLFLIVILAVMAVIAQNTSGMSMLFLILISFLVMPVMIATFVLIMSSVNREVRIS